MSESGWGWARTAVVGVALACGLGSGRHPAALGLMSVFAERAQAGPPLTEPRERGATGSGAALQSALGSVNRPDDRVGAGLRPSWLQGLCAAPEPLPPSGAGGSAPVPSGTGPSSPETFTALPAESGCALQTAQEADSPGLPGEAAPLPLCTAWEQSRGAGLGEQRSHRRARSPSPLSSSAGRCWWG